MIIIEVTLKCDNCGAYREPPNNSAYFNLKTAAKYIIKDLDRLEEESDFHCLKQPQANFHFCPSCKIKLY